MTITKRDLAAALEVILAHMQQTDQTTYSAETKEGDFFLFAFTGPNAATMRQALHSKMRPVSFEIISDTPSGDGN